MEKTLAHRRHDISDHAWELIKPLLPERPGSWSGIAQDNRLFINAVFWILRTEAPWRDLPPDYGDWKNTHRRFSRWMDKSTWEKLFKVLMDDPDFEWLMIDASHAKIHPHAAAPKVVMKLYRPYKRGAQRKNTYCRRCEWYAGESAYHLR